MANSVMGIRIGVNGDAPTLSALSEDILKIETSGPDFSSATALSSTYLTLVTANPPYRYRRS